MDSTRSDALLVEQCRAGDTAAFSLLVERHQARLRHVLRAVSYANDIEDVMQEAFLQAFLSLDRLERPSRFRAWVTGIALNLARMGYRREQRWLLWEDVGGWETAASTSSVQAFSHHQPTPEQIAEKEETMARLNEAIADLPPGERQALLLVYRDGLNHRQTADELGISLSAVKVRVHRGRRRLQAMLTSVAEEPVRPALAEEETMIPVEIYDVLAHEINQTVNTNPEFQALLALAPPGKRPLLEDQFTYTLTSKHGMFGLWTTIESITENMTEEEAGAVRAQLGAFIPHRVVLLKEKEGQRGLPIWIGPTEGEAIVLKLRSQEVKRPISFDLTKTLLDLGGVQVEKAAVSRLHEGIFYGTLYVRFQAGGDLIKVDCRPSDALGLTVRMEIPFLVAPEVMDEASVLPDENGRYPIGGDEQTQMEWRSLLR
ncbi:MAG: sigma-70 family RNA polymerase sigma factor [Aquificales bacterium]|nr:sigma-70 family RNA polymerase sigma factor [Aquificales bacterium]